MLIKFKRITQLALACCFAAGTLAAHAQSSTPVTILVGTPPGGSIDGLARVLAQRLPEHLDGRTVVVENKSGALGAIALRELSASPADRLIFGIGPFTNLLFPALTNASVRFDAFKEFQTVATLSSFQIGVAVSSATGVKTPKELVAWLNQNPRKVQIGIGGLGGQTHFLGLQLADAVNVKAPVVPYKGNNPLLSDLMAGHIPLGVLVAGEARRVAGDGRINVVGMLTPKRSPLAPEIPTFAEQGINVTSGESWFGMWASSHMPKAEVHRMEEAVKKILAAREVQEALAERYAMVADFRSSEETARRLRVENDLWGPVIKASGFKAD